MKSDSLAAHQAPPEPDMAAIRQRVLSGDARHSPERPGGDGGSNPDIRSPDASPDTLPEDLARVPAKAKENAFLDFDADSDTAEPSADLDPSLDLSLDTSSTERELADIRRRALNLLARREHARAELERKLAAKGSPLDAIREVLDRIQSQGLLSEERFAERYAASRKERGYGPLRILDELRERGIGDDLAEGTVDLRAKDWFDLAATAHRRHFGEERPDNYPDWARRARFLERRGFIKDHIRAVLGMSFDDF
ncbi:regulatory protein RecX [Thioalkalivibrio sp. HK1]|uniref:regulatory protein RecX n=1 Tax=Thioalkalivibrio sp. HK1 TaxID=1469245 RepID=UPI001E4D0CE8|nr:regulatory protein RecX [Thioalkalivibrio sp. HK1]